MISTARSREEEYGVYYENTRSLCSHTQSTLERETGESQSALLRESLDCLAQAIERLSSSYKIFNTSFSWTLDLNVSLYVEKSTESKYSTDESEGEKIVEAPMIILDELGVCEQRAKTILETGATATLPGMLDGREKHKLARLKKIAAIARRSLHRRDFKTVYTEIESPLPPLYTVIRDKHVVLRGKPDIVLLVETPSKQLAIVNIEYSTYTTAPRTVIYRQAMYAHTLYKVYGFPVVPALLVDASNRRDAYILVKKNERTLETKLRTMLTRLSQLKESTSARPARSKEACHTCPLPIRNTCPHYGA
jgi:hypothetical protein